MKPLFSFAPWLVAALALHVVPVWALSEGDVDVTRPVSPVTLRVAWVPPQRETPPEPKIAEPAAPSPAPRPVRQQRQRPARDPLKRKLQAKTIQAPPSPKPVRRTLTFSMSSRVGVESTEGSGEPPPSSERGERRGGTPGGKGPASGVRGGDSDRAPVTRPQRLSKIVPRYPDHLRALRIETRVVVRIQLDRDGRVKKAKVIRPSADPAFDQAALRAAYAERFSAATRGGQPIEYALSFTYRFRISR